jgi:DNA-binding LacI/PurR family transcriptional regulator
VELERDGLIYRIRGKGSFVREKSEVDAHVGISDFALVVPEARHIYSSLLYGFEVAASEHNAQVTICSTDNDIHKQGNLILQLLRKKVAGLAMVPATSPPTPVFQIQELQERGIPVVLCHRRVEGVKAPFISIPFKKAGRMAGECLVQHGHSRVAYISNLKTEATMAYKEGLREALQAVGLELNDKFVYFGNKSPQNISQQKSEVSQALRKMSEDPDPPTAIFTSCDPMAEMLYLLLESMNLKIPEDISVISFGDAHRVGVLISRITAVVVNESDLGRQALKLLTEMCSGKLSIDDESTIVMPLSLSTGSTLSSPS